MQLAKPDPISPFLTQRIAYGSLMVLTLAGCVTAGGLLGETPGERFRKAISEQERYCSTHQMAPGETTCDILKLKAPDPLATPEGRFAHSIKLPPPHDKPKEVYRAGMTSEEYFKALCDAEAGEFIFKTVANVEGIFQMRPRMVASDDILHHLFAIEDPYGYTRGEATQAEYLFVGGYRYSYFESPIRDLSDAPAWDRQYKDPSYFLSPSADKTIQRFHGYNNRDLKSMMKEFDRQSKARYGYTWRGISRGNDRELGIAGGELIVLDLLTGEVLAFRRGFVRTSYVRNVPTTIDWEFAQVCPRYGYRGGRDKDFDFSYWFIRKVLKPINLTKPEPFLDANGR